MINQPVPKKMVKIPDHCPFNILTYRLEPQGLLLELSMLLPVGLQFGIASLLHRLLLVVKMIPGILYQLSYRLGNFTAFPFIPDTGE